MAEGGHVPGERKASVVGVPGAPSGLRQFYENKRAVVIGIDNYAHHPKLGYAVADAVAMLLRGAAHHELKDPGAAAGEWNALAELHPSDEYAGWGRCAAAACRGPGGRRHALLVGVSSHLHYPDVTLKGPGNDVRNLEKLLTERLHFEVENVESLLDENATAAGITGALTALAQRTRAEDTVLFYFSGNAYLEAPDPTLVAPDGPIVAYAAYDYSNDKDGAILTEVDIDRLLVEIPAQNKVIITDACHLSPPINRRLGYRFLSAGKRDQEAIESAAEDGTIQGAFTRRLLSALVAQPAAASVADLIRAVRRSLGEDLDARQTPQYSGDPSRPFLGAEASAEQALFALAQRRFLPCLSTFELLNFASWIEAHELGFKGEPPAPSSLAPIRLGLARALVERKRFRAATTALGPLASTASREVGALIVELSAQIGSHAYSAAQHRVSSAAIDPDTTAMRDTLSELSAVVDGLARGVRRALLVVGNDFLADARKPMDQKPEDRGSPVIHRDAVALRDALIIDAGLDPANVTLLTLSGTTPEAVAKTIHEFASSQEGPGFLFIAGAVSVNSEGASIYLDRSQSIRLYELSPIGRDPKSLITAVLATSMTVVGRAERDLPRIGVASFWWTLDPLPAVGATAHRNLSGGEKRVPPPLRPPPLRNLAATLGDEDAAGLTMRQWVERAGFGGLRADRGRRRRSAAHRYRAPRPRARTPRQTHLARVIKQLIEQDLKAQIRSSLIEYVKLGAPAGLDDDLGQFL
jgi:hypothetical protein